MLINLKYSNIENTTIEITQLSFNYRLRSQTALIFTFEVVRNIGQRKFVRDRDHGPKL